MTNIKFPDPPDSWCEDSLSHSEGYWDSFANSTVTVDTAVFAVGGSSIKANGINYSDSVGAEFRIHAPYFNGTPSNVTLHFLINLQGGVTLTGDVYVSLIDANNRGCYKTIRVNALGVWEPKELTMSEFVADPNFNWTQIAEIRINATKRLSAANIWIDQLYFSYDLPDSSVIMTSNPSGKNGLYGDPLYGDWQFTTPSQFTRPIGLTGWIQMEAENFDRWADTGSKYQVRNFTFQPTNTTLLAIYTLQPNPLITINSLDQDMNVIYAESAVRVTFGGVFDDVRVPLGWRTPNKGVWTFTAIETNSRKFAYWIKPDGTQTTAKNITWNVQGDISLAVHWIVSGGGGGGGSPELFPMLAVLGLVAVGAIILFKQLRINRK